MKQADFVHLHNHTEYSLLDGAIRIKEAVARAREFGMPALAITDHGNLFGAVEFYPSARAADVKPIIGCEVYVAPGKRTDRDPGQGAASTSHLTLLARDRAGYQNLVRLVSIGYLEGFYYKPRIDREALTEHAEGLLAMSACLKGEIPRSLLAEKRERASETAGFYSELFGPGNFYLEIMNHGLPDEETVAREVVRMAREMNLPLVATNDCHYLQADHARAHDILLCLQTGKDLDDPRRLRFSHDTFYMRPPEEMRELFREVPQAIANTLAVAERCNLDLTPGRFQLPDFPIPEGYADAAAYLEALARRGLVERRGEISTAHEERLRFELATVSKMGFDSYFLIIKDLIDAARGRGIPVGPGRGSVVGSLVAYALGITALDPLEHGLLFERFLNPDRVTMPDIDIDFCYERRNEVIEYARERYGAESLAQIITFGTMAARAAIRDVGRVMRVPYAEVDRLAKLIPGELNMTLEKALERSAELKQVTEESETYRELVTQAQALEGMSRHASTHAAGVVIAPGKLTDYVPLFQSTRGEITTQYDMGSIERMGMLKIDLLGLRTLTVIHDTAAMIRERTGVEVDPARLPLEDPEVFRLLGEGNTVGLFQVESSGMRDLLKRLQPDCFEDVVAVNALYRPGPLGTGMVDDFIDGKRGKKSITYLHPALEPLLRPTYGVILYQEQVMAIAHQFAGFSLGQADLLRRAMAKKKHDVMAQQKAAFVESAAKKDVPEAISGRIFDLMAHFAGYGFNKSHSAAYALVTVTTAWLKAHHPREFMAATLSSEMGDSDRLVTLIDEARRMGIPVLPPDVNASEARFTVVDEGIRFGLAAVKNVGMGAVEAVIAARADGPFTNVFDFASRVDSKALNRRALESLVAAGAFDSLEPERASLLATVPLAIDYGVAAQRDRERGQVSLFDESLEGDGWAGVEPRLSPAEAWSRHEFLSREKDALGFYISGHPMEGYENELGRVKVVPLGELAERGETRSIKVAGMVTECRRITDKKGKEMAFVTIEDRTGSVELLLFSDVFAQHGSKVEDGVPLLATGKLSIREEEDPKIIARELRRLDEVGDDFVEEAGWMSDTAPGEYLPSAEDLAALASGPDPTPSAEPPPATPAPEPPADPVAPPPANGDSRLHLSLAAPRDDDLLPVLQEIVARHPGEVPLVLHLATESRGEVDIESALSVHPTPQLLEELHRLLGSDRVRLGGAVRA